MRLLICLLIIASSTLTFAQTELNELCLQSNIKSLQHLDLDHWEGENICEKSLENLSQAERRNLEAIYDVHKRAADLFGIEISELFNSPLEVSMLETTLGGLASYAGNVTISMGVYPKSDYAFNKGIYAHELGHVLSGSENSKLPSSFSDLDNSILFTEMFADLLSLTLFDNIILPVQGEESCIDRARYIARGQTYNMAEEYFLSDFSMARVAKCCESSTIKNSHPFVNGLCEEISRMGEFQVKLSKPFDPMTVNLSQIDNHQIGIPLLSFLKELSKQTKRELRDIFRLGFKQAAPQSESFSCEVNYQGKKIFEDKHSRHTVRSFLQDLKNNLNIHEKMTYDLLASKHAIEKGLVFGDRDTVNSIYDKSVSQFRTTLNPGHVCLNNFELSTGTHDQCVLTCQKN